MEQEPQEAQEAQEADAELTRAQHLLQPYSSCEVADALVQLGQLGCFVPDVHPLGGGRRVIGRAFPVAFVALERDHETVPTASSNSSSKPHYIDHPDIGPGWVVVIQAPSNAIHAVWGGLVAARAQERRIAGAVIQGRVRDQHELHALGSRVWCSGTSSLGAARYGRVGSVGETIMLSPESTHPVRVQTGDLVVADEDGVVVFPLSMLEAVMDRCRRIAEVDARCLAEVRAGHSLTEAFAKHRT